MVNIIQDEALCFDDVTIMDGYNWLESRSQVSLSQLVKGRLIDLPIMAASMDTVSSPRLAKALARRGGVCIHHRYSTIDERIKACKSSFSLHEEEWDPHETVGVAVGFKDSASDIERLVVEGWADIISIDVASANHENTIRMLCHIGPLCEEMNVILMVGNFSDEFFVQVLEQSGVLKHVDYLKVSQGSGSACTTRINIGCGKPTFQAVVDLHNELQRKNHLGAYIYSHRPMIVADGGIKYPGDIVKALGAGADMVMLGSMLAGFDESAGEVVIGDDGREYKSFRGMASADAKESHFNEARNVEGVSTMVPYKGPVDPFLLHLEQCIKSGIATAGFCRLVDFIGQAKFRRVTTSTFQEGKPHILS